jgi:regulator of RNase E activity RraA
MTGLASRLQSLDSCAVSDAIDRLGARGGAADGLFGVTGDQPVAGPVRTVKLVPADGRPTTTHLAARLLDDLEPGEVILVGNAGRWETACFGGTLARGARRAQAAGVILDGCCRDVTEIRELGIRLFGRGTSLRAARGRIMEEGHDLPVLVSGQDVRSGDWVLADSNGVVFIGKEHVADVLATAEDIVRREAAMADAIEAGMPMQEVMGASYEALTRAQHPES